MSSKTTPYQSTPRDRTRALALGIWYVVLAVVLGYMLFKIWPPVPWPDPINRGEVISRALLNCGYPVPSPAPTPSGSPTTEKSAPVEMPINFFSRKCVMTSFDERLLLLVIIAGMLGSFVHGATSLADYIGNDCFNRKWTWFYLLRPVIGMALALVFYFVIRGGFLTTNVGATDINPYGVAALAGLVGMFSKQATDKLSEVFGTLFKSGSGEGDEKREDPLVAKPSTVAFKIDPPEVIAGSDEITIMVMGTDFVEGSTVFLNDSAQPTTFESVTQLSAQVAKETIANPGVLKLTVVNPDLSKSTPVDFIVRAASTSSPVIESVDPPYASIGSSGQTITVKGTGFVDGSKIDLNGFAQETVFESANQLSAKLGEASIAIAGPLKLRVVNPDGSASTEIDFMVADL